MDYVSRTIYILKKLGIYNMYKGCDYIVSCVRFIHDNQSSYLPVTKILYYDIAKQYNTSTQCVEKNIRKVIDIIWNMDEFPEIFNDIINPGSQSRKPGNSEFLISLYNHIESNEYSDKIFNINKDKIKYICPLTNEQCGFCNEILYQIVQAVFLKRWTILLISNCGCPEPNLFLKIL